MIAVLFQQYREDTAHSQKLLRILHFAFFTFSFLRVHCFSSPFRSFGFLILSSLPVLVSGFFILFSSFFSLFFYPSFCLHLKFSSDSSFFVTVSFLIILHFVFFTLPRQSQLILDEKSILLRLIYRFIYLLESFVFPLLVQRLAAFLLLRLPQELLL